ncbi:MAG TPA: TetR/AcrR family transcriptional regulator [Dokdonella sp.]|uniref:TetR/AcrR family transcriptional regulator n=3 Tax=Dokdonella sp. TaxID=2291710 RepID=UPI002C9E069E|nr:TetR/AcrR family transcriptional regulator [Dokdonella sp.]HOX70521.1 TetR/AcrR family transcriptional regulator [Dokdonella sp.]HPG93358.1 TetR/AcrR family transcriptional regulator [Dokdonella sp.]HPN78258.1 TetR/AcrR family transcriptional regulator [Dokdonella sp.]
MNPASAKSCGPGRPKDLEKRAAILQAAKQLFPEHGFDGTSMDTIAALAGVSKLTVYSHFVDKERLFIEAVREKCAEQMPFELFDVDVSGPIREQLMAIARAFFALVTSEESISLHRLLTTGAGGSGKLAQMFWEAGPQTLQAEFAGFLKREVEAGQLEIADIERAAAQFFCLLKGELHARQLCGCSAAPITQLEIDRHLTATVEFFLRAYASRRSAVGLSP